MLEIIVITSWACFVVYSLWFSTAAKHYAPITQNDARILWKIHKKNIKCNSKKWRAIKKGKKIIGFECECGFKHIQRRPIVGNAPTPYGKSQNRRNSINKLETTYKTIDYRHAQ